MDSFTTHDLKYLWDCVFLPAPRLFVYCFSPSLLPFVDDARLTAKWLQSRFVHSWWHIVDPIALSFTRCMHLHTYCTYIPHAVAADYQCTASYRYTLFVVSFNLPSLTPHPYRTKRKRVNTIGCQHKQIRSAAWLTGRLAGWPVSWVASSASPLSRWLPSSIVPLLFLFAQMSISFLGGAAIRSRKILLFPVASASSIHHQHRRLRLNIWYGLVLYCLFCVN